MMLFYPVLLHIIFIMVMHLRRNNCYYKVSLWQSAVAFLLALFLSFFGKTKESFVSYFQTILEDNSRASQFAQSAEAMLNFVTSLNESEPETESSDLSKAVGGEDIEIYEAAENTSFAPISSTAKILMPVSNGRYTSFFGYRINPITGKLSFHTGVDIAAAEGTNISAAFSGIVKTVGEDERAGKYIIIEHDQGLVTFYCHCSEILVEECTVIRQGETVALVGSTGWSTGPHLHFEVRRNNIRYNPLWLLENDYRA